MLNAQRHQHIVNGTKDTADFFTAYCNVIAVDVFEDQIKL
jgi:hypothetical protein